MPIISIFFGIVVRINFGDHAPPHLHAEYQGEEALFDLRTAEVIAGHLPRSARRLVTDWMTRHQADLLRNWDLASRGQPTFRIEGLDNERD
ncbi:MAG TPA: DUF4160 domain-containing protein [Caulobacteraceae bacterium]